MPRLHLRPSQPDRQHRLLHVTPESAGWTYVGFDLHKLPQGASAGAETADRETCLVFIAGRGHARRVREIVRVAGHDSQGYRLEPSIGPASSTEGNPT